MEKELNKLKQTSYYDVDDPASFESELHHLQNELKDTKKYLIAHCKGHGRVSKKMTLEQAKEILYEKNDSLYDQSVKTVDESFAQFFNNATYNYDHNKKDYVETLFLKDKEFTDSDAESTFGHESYNNMTQKEVYVAITDFYRKLRENIDDTKTILQIILPFSKYVHDKREFDHILSSDAVFNEFLDLANRTENKRDVAKKWLEKSAVEYLPKMFESAEEHTTQQTKDGVFEKIRKYLYEHMGGKK